MIVHRNGTPALQSVCSPPLVFAPCSFWQKALSLTVSLLVSVVDLTPAKKKRGRPPKQQDKERTAQQQQEEEEAEAAKKAKRALNRFNGMSVAEVMAKTLPDVITYNLDILIVSFTPQQQFINPFHPQKKKNCNFFALLPR